jgi:hypothetical protein
MRRALRLFVCVALAAVAGYLFTYPLVAKAPQEGPPKGGHSDLTSGLDRYCITCHNAKLKTAGLSLEQVDPTRVGSDPEMWEKLVRKLRTHEMPPQGLPRPDGAAYAQLASTLEATCWASRRCLCQRC